MSIVVKIVSAEKLVFNEEAESVVVPTENGEMEILPEHLPILSVVSSGLVVVKFKDHNETIAVSEGFVRVHSNCVDLLIEEAIDVRNINLSDIEDGISRAKEAINNAREQMLPDIEIKQLEAKLQYLFAKKLGKEKRN